MSTITDAGGLPHNQLSGKHRGQWLQLCLYTPLWFSFAFAILTASHLAARGLTHSQYKVLQAFLDMDAFTTLAELLVRYAALCGFLATFSGFAAFMLIEAILPFINGYCYTCGFILGHRLIAVRRHGLSPFWTNVLQDPALDHTIKYEISGNEIFHLKACLRGDSIENVTQYIGTSRVGGGAYLIPCFTFYQYVQQMLRVITLGSIFVFQLEITTALAVAAVAIGAFVVCADCTFYVFSVALVVFRLEPQYAIMIGAAVFLGGEFTKTLLFVPNYDHWSEDPIEPPPVINYPAGLPPSGRVHNYNLQDRNGVYESVPFIHVDMPAEDKAKFAAQTGLNPTDIKSSGNPHKQTAIATKYLIWQATMGWSWDDQRVWFNVAGLFRGLPQKVCGVGLQPKLSDSDGANYELYGTDVGLGQMVIDDHLSTVVGPVGDTTITYEPGITVTGIGGADIFMIHCYDIPVKALLGLAYANNSMFVNVIMHADPTMFRETEGSLHWSSQKWSRDVKTGKVFYRWMDTNGRTFEHDYRVIYEHLNTDYVCVAPGVWYVGTIHRNVFDVYHMRWTRQFTKPMRCDMRTVTMQPRRDATVVPAIEDHGLFRFKIHRYTLSVQKAEYIQTSKNMKDLAVSLRALTDNYYRNQGESEGHIMVNMINDLDHGKRIVENLRMAIEKGRNFSNTMSSVLGLSPDHRALKGIANCLYKYLTKQPAYYAVCKTLYQDEPYMMVREMPPIVRRTLPMATFETDGNLVAQESLDNIKSDRIVLLKGIGDDMSKQLCHVLFGRTVGIQPILPVGLPEHGGSVLIDDSPYLIPAEIEYLIEILNIQFCVLKGGEMEVFGRLTNEGRQTFVMVDFDLREVSRIHYPTHMSAEKLRSGLGAVQSDFVADQAWVMQMHNTNAPREYVRHPLCEDSFRAMVTEKIHQQRDAIKSSSARDTYMKEINLEGEVNKYREWDSNGIRFNMELPVLSQSSHCFQYDRNHNIGDTGLVPAHHYAARGALGLRQIRKH